MATELPAGWVETTLGEACTVVGGGTPDTKNARYWGGDVQWLTPADLSGYTSTYISSGARALTQAGLDNSGARVLPRGTVLFSSRAPIGHVAIAGQPMATNQGFKSVIPPEGVASEYLYWYLRWATPSIKDMGSGTTFTEVSGRVMATVPLLLPPTAEQRRIVRELERRLSHVDAVERDLTGLIEKLAVVRSVIIHSAMTGTLVAGGDGIATVNAEEGTERGDAVPPVPPHWRWSLLKDILREPMRNGRSAPTAPAGVGVRVYAITAVTRRDWGLHHTKWAVGDPTTLTDLFVKDGDIFVQRSNTPELVGSSALYRGPDGVSTFPDLLIRLRPSDEVAPEWLEAVLLWSSTRTYLRSVASGLSGSMPKIDQGKVGKVRVPIPPLDEQLAILAEMNRRLSLVDAAVSAVQNGLGKCTQVRKSVLAAAFTGQLSTQDAREEPASVLLDRIKGQRQAAEPARKPGRKRRAKKETTK